MRAKGKKKEGERDKQQNPPKLRRRTRDIRGVEIIGKREILVGRCLYQKKKKKVKDRCRKNSGNHLDQGGLAAPKGERKPHEKKKREFPQQRGEKKREKKRIGMHRCCFCSTIIITIVALAIKGEKGDWKGEKKKEAGTPDPDGPSPGHSSPVARAILLKELGKKKRGGKKKA